VHTPLRSLAFLAFRRRRRLRIFTVSLGWHIQESFHYALHPTRNLFLFILGHHHAAFGSVASRHSSLNEDILPRVTSLL
jgi:hypothetical protein